MARLRLRAALGRRLWPFLTAGTTMVALMLLVVSAASSGPVGTAAGFEDDDGNLAPEAPINFDWNSFAPTTWTGTAPTRTSSKLVSGWAFTGLEDAEKSGSDSNFAGGTKQDNECPGVGAGSSSNKDDLKRVYFASKTVNGHVFLELAWVRTSQNTTSSSAHVAFEFNQGTTACGAGSDALVKRTTANGGDMLIVYDFEGGTATPTLKLSRWIASGTCEVGSSSPPCWGEATSLTAGVAEAKVFAATSTTPTVSDTIAPTSENLGDSEFGEAGIDLTAAGVFPANTCVAFGQGYAVSRSSGNSAQAQMKDLVGPGTLDINNCGRVIIHKVTDPSPDPTDTTFNYTTTGGLNPASFPLKNGETRDYGQTVQAGSYSVTEADPSPRFVLIGIDCSKSVVTHGSTFTPDTSTRTVSFDLKPLDTIECTFTNKLQRGNIVINKVTDPRPDPTDTSFPFTLTDGPSNLNQSFSLKDGGSHDSGPVLVGSGYSAVETVPANWELVSAVCNDGSPVTNIDVSADETVICTFTDRLLVGAIRVTKHSSKDNSALEGATFEIRDSNNTLVATLTSGSDGTACKDNLFFGSYTVTETAAPAGYKIDDPGPASVLVDHVASCTNGTPNEPPVFTDTPLSRITVSFESLAPGNPTTATIDCGNGSVPLPEGTPHVLDNLAPGSYSCTVVVDP
jgi:hypothetical protein